MRCIQTFCFKIGVYWHLVKNHINTDANPDKTQTLINDYVSHNVNIEMNKIDDYHIDSKLQTEKHISAPNVMLTLSPKMSWSNFKIISTIGKGSFGKVVLVFNEINSKNYAMKILNKQQIAFKKQIDHTKTERIILEKIRHPFIIELHYAFQTQTHLYWITDFMIGGELFFHLRRETYFSESRTRLYTSELVLALSYWHKNKIIYRDWKPENILLDEFGHWKIIDFGLSKILNHQRNASLSGCNHTEIKELTKAYTICGTTEYLAPEVLIGKGYDKAIDLWSLGVLIYEMLTGTSPFKELNTSKIDWKVYKKKIYHHRNVSDDAYDLITKLLQFNPMKRIGNGIKGIEEIKKHSFFKGVNWEDVWSKKTCPSFKPKLRGSNDISYFDKDFTSETLKAEDNYETNKESADCRDNPDNDKKSKKMKKKDFAFNIYDDFDFQRNQGQ